MGQMNQYPQTTTANSIVTRAYHSSCRPRSDGMSPIEKATARGSIDVKRPTMTADYPEAGE